MSIAPASVPVADPAPTMIDDPDKVRALRRMKGVALGLLVFAALVFLFAMHMEESGGPAYWGYIRAMGEAGVTKALEVIQKELDISMALCGVQKASQISREHVLVPADFEGNWA